MSAKVNRAILRADWEAVRSVSFAAAIGAGALFAQFDTAASIELLATAKAEVPSLESAKAA